MSHSKPCKHKNTRCPSFTDLFKLHIMTPLESNTEIRISILANLESLQLNQIYTNSVQIRTRLSCHYAVEFIRLDWIRWDRWGGSGLDLDPWHHSLDICNTLSQYDPSEARDAPLLRNLIMLRDSLWVTDWVASSTFTEQRTFVWEYCNHNHNWAIT